MSTFEVFLCAGLHDVYSVRVFERYGIDGAQDVVLMTSGDFDALEIDPVHRQRIINSAINIVGTKK